MNVFIVTGASRGLGNAIARKLVDKKNYLLCISRKIDESLVKYASERQCKLSFYEYDLSNVSEIEKLMDTIFDKLNLKEVESISLINNAGTLSPIKPIEKCKDTEIIGNIHVNLIAPIVLTSSFIRNLNSFKGDKRVINISSGAGKKPLYGWSNYCASKAGLDLFTQCVGLEQNTYSNTVKIVSLAPGIMDTKMQEEIRKTEKENFQQVEKFIDYKKNGNLLPTDYVAEKVIKLLSDKEFIQGGVIDVRDME